MDLDSYEDDLLNGVTTELVEDAVNRGYVMVNLPNKNIFKHDLVLPGKRARSRKTLE